MLTTADVPNRFPQLPVREGEHALVWVAPEATGIPPAVAALLRAEPLAARLRPTAQSQHLHR